MSIETRNGGQIDNEQLVSLDHVSLTLNPTATFATAHITAFTNGSINATRAVDLSGVVDLHGSTVTVNAGGSMDLSAVTNIDGANLYVYSGTLAFPSVTRYDGSNVRGQPTMRASGVGSVLDLSHVTEFRGPAGDYGYIFSVSVQATAGGKVDLSGTASIPSGTVYALADGAASTLNFSTLQSVTATAHGGSFEARHTGSILTPQLTRCKRQTEARSLPPPVRPAIRAQLTTAP